MSERSPGSPGRPSLKPRPASLPRPARAALVTVARCARRARRRRRGPAHTAGGRAGSRGSGRPRCRRAGKPPTAHPVLRSGWKSTSRLGRHPSSAAAFPAVRCWLRSDDGRAATTHLGVIMGSSAAAAGPCSSLTGAPRAQAARPRREPSAVRMVPRCSANSAVISWSSPSVGLGLRNWEFCHLPSGSWLSMNQCAICTR
jgi:hypothetical protein